MRWSIGIFVSPVNGLRDPHRHLIETTDDGRTMRGSKQEEPAMQATDVAIWLLTGLIAGWLAGAVNPEAPRLGRLTVVGAGVAGALVGGSIVGSLAMSAVAFLGAASAAVLTALLAGALLGK
jgi:uncharacterized membrane protein YeaQ/YmgE (transglycosylase-associated protein family)